MNRERTETMIRVVFFDIDDTLLSFSGYVKEAMKSGFALFGLPPYREEMFPVFERINTGLWKRLEEGVLTFEELIGVRWDMIFKALGISFDGKTFEDYFRKQLFVSAVLEPGAIELLGYLKDKYVLCTASNGPYAQQINRLKLGGLHDCFEHIFVSEKIGVSKPDPAFFDFCFKELRESGLTDLRPEESIIIGDSPSSDIAGGKAYGLKTCLYDGKAADAGARAAADYTVSRLCEITEIL